MYGEAGNKLVRYHFATQSTHATFVQVSTACLTYTQVQNAKRTLALPHLPPYASELTRSIIREVRDLDKDVSNILAPFSGSFNPSASPETACALLVNHLCMRRNKRCLLAYHRVRSDKLEEYCWEGIDVLEQQGGSGEGRGGMGSGGGKEESSLSPEEEEYVRQYSDLLAAYKGQWTDIDLTGSLEPPKDLFIDVRVLKDAGEIQTEYGYVHVPSIPCFFTASRTFTGKANESADPSR